MSERWRETYDQWKLATPPEHEGEEEDSDDLDRYDDDDMEDADEWVLDCGDPNCCMPGYHFRSECHTPEMMEAQYEEAERDASSAAGDP